MEVERIRFYLGLEKNMEEITNRILERATGYTNPQIKRWAVAFLKADIFSGQHSGVPRTYNFEQSVRIVLGGSLVDKLNFTLIEANTIADDIIFWMKKKGWDFSKLEYTRPPENNSLRNANLICEELIVNIGIKRDKLKAPIKDRVSDIKLHDCFYYSARIVTEKKEIPSKKLFSEKYKLEYFGTVPFNSSEPFHSINMGGLINSLLRKINEVKYN